LQKEIVRIQVAVYSHSGAAVDVAEKTFKLLTLIPVSWTTQAT